MSDEKPKLSLTAARRLKQEVNRRNRAARVQRAIKLYKSGVIKSRIAEDLGVHFETVSRWLKGIEVDVPAKPDPEAVAEVYAQKLEEAVAETKLAVREEEEQDLLEIAENQASPADKYQAYVAASAIKMLRDNLLNIRGPRTVRELSELDQLIRRNLGLNPKGNGGSGSLVIDVSILNNGKATNGGAASVVVEAEEVDD